MVELESWGCSGTTEKNKIRVTISLLMSSTEYPIFVEAFSAWLQRHQEE